MTERSTRYLTAILWLAWGLGAIVTALGLVAAWIPALDLVNHLRIFAVGAAVLIFVAAMTVRDGRLIRLSAALALLQVGLMLLPLAHAARSEPGKTPALRLVTFNLATNNERFEDIAAFILGSGADIVLFQEVSCAAVDKLMPKLRPSYPHALVSADTCHGMALLSKRPWTSGGQVTVGHRRPLLMWARFNWNGAVFDLTAAHLARPTSSTDQANHVARLLAHLATRGPTQILTGDLNLTPFAWQFAQLNTAGLHQHATFLASWPAAAPLFPIDHVLSTNNVASTRIATGPALGSDHRPVIADIAFVK